MHRTALFLASVKQFTHLSQFPPLKFEIAKWALVPGGQDMAHDSLAFRFAVVLGLAVIILVAMTLAAPPPPANGTAAPVPSSDPIYRAQYLNLY